MKTFLVKSNLFESFIAFLKSNRWHLSCAITKHILFNHLISFMLIIYEYMSKYLLGCKSLAIKLSFCASFVWLTVNIFFLSFKNEVVSIAIVSTSAFGYFKLTSFY